MGMPSSPALVDEAPAKRSNNDLMPVLDFHRASAIAFARRANCSLHGSRDEYMTSLRSTYFTPLRTTQPS
jgi:hypothetical protein